MYEVHIRNCVVLNIICYSIVILIGIRASNFQSQVIYQIFFTSVLVSTVRSTESLIVPVSNDYFFKFSLLYGIISHNQNVDVS